MAKVYTFWHSGIWPTYRFQDTPMHEDSTEYDIPDEVVDRYNKAQGEFELAWENIHKYIMEQR